MLYIIEYVLLEKIQHMDKDFTLLVHIKEEIMETKVPGKVIYSSKILNNLIGKDCCYLYFLSGWVPAIIIVSSTYLMFF